MKTVVQKETVTEEGGAWLKCYVPKFKEIEKYFNNDIAMGWLKIDDNRTISANQRKFIYAIIKDISIHINGYVDEILIAYYKGIFKSMLIEKDLIDDYFSLSDCSITQANLMIDLMIQTVFDFNIAISVNTVDIIRDTEQWQHHCVMNRKCCVGSNTCSKAVHIHHATNLVGMGNKRSHHDHINSTFMALCSIHHTEIDSLGLTNFLEKYHVVPTKLSKDEIKELKI